MTSTSKTFVASAATLFASAFLMMTAPAAQAEDYCITNGAQAAHGCGYPTMEACRAAAGGIGGSCSQAGGGAKSTNDALAFQPKQAHPRTKLRPGGQTNSN
ncbi:DUF3551 domain-containing protein [Bradyrhizobium diazoefficiens]|nr:DUF3551 domain-containing protein [Bradyrhizobium diazoefficiens]MBR0775325.1 DUF3551 domain-containing protein [Bradyrhizobium diazoefficiens]